MSYEKQNFEDGQVLEAEHLNHMEDELARPKSWNELADRPFGEKDIVIYSGDMYLEYSAEDGFGCAEIEFPEGNGLDNEKVRIKWGGTVYELNRGVVEEYGLYYFGNLGLAGMEDTGEPFLIQCVENAWLIVENTTESHTVPVEISHKGIVKLPDIYYTGSVILYSGDGVYLYTINSTSEKHRLTKDQLLEIAKSGKHATVKVNSQYYTVMKFDFSYNIEYGMVTIGGYDIESPTGVASFFKRYTAEYTPPTT